MLLGTTVHYPSVEEEARRQSVLAELGILNSEKEAAFDQLAKILAAICGCSSAWITFVSKQQEWAKASVGVSVSEVPRDASPSRFVLESPSVTVLRFPVLDPSPLGAPVAFFAGAPIRMDGVAIGTIAVMDTQSRDITPSQSLALTLLADHARWLLENRSHVKRLEAELEDRDDSGLKLAELVTRLQNAHLDLQAQGLELSMANARLQVLAETDGLTGLRNRRALYEEMSRRMSESEPMSVVLLDLDGFKAFNDRHGHLAGDEALRILAQLLSSSVRGADIAARYGGEEFVLLLGDVPGSNALEIAERLRRQVERYPWPLTPLTLSAGVATSTSDVLDPETLVLRADSALYAAKRTGKNRVLAWVSG
jgi:diguanylate cyclase (GGDEF)-like protein